MANSLFSQLAPNSTYHGPNNSVYHTDEYGRIVSWEGEISSTAEPRNYAAQRNLPGKNDMQSHAGHLIATSQGGSGEAYNMVAQSAALNTRDYRAFERENAQLYASGAQVHLSGSLTYISSPTPGVNIPDALMVDRTVTYSDGRQDVSNHSQTNLDMSEFIDKGEAKSAELMDQTPNPGAYIYNEENQTAYNAETNDLVDINQTDADMQTDTVADTVADTSSDLGGLDDSESDGLSL